MTTISFDKNLLCHLKEALSAKRPVTPSLLLLSSPTVFALHGKKCQEKLESAGFSVNTVLIEEGEKSKSLEMAKVIWEKMFLLGLDRNSPCVVLGGGVLTDLGGFTASCYMRGVPLVFIPTSLLAMIDSAIGGKTAVNLPLGKNIIGSIYPPEITLILPEYLTTLPKSQLPMGLAEAIKYGLIRSKDLFEFLEKEYQAICDLQEGPLAYLVKSCVDIKSEIVSQDLFDTKGLRAHLNLGHTFAHAIESLSDHKIPHGHAVAIGLSCALHLGALLNKNKKALINRVEELLINCGLQTRLPDFNDEELIHLMRKDKKATHGKLTFILCTEIGQAEVVCGVDPEVVRQALTQKRNRDG